MSPKAQPPIVGTAGPGSGPGGKVRRQDIEDALRKVGKQLLAPAEAAIPRSQNLIIAAVALGVVATYLLGRRSGRRRSTVVEVRRV